MLAQRQSRSTLIGMSMICVQTLVAQLFSVIGSSSTLVPKTDNMSLDVRKIGVYQDLF